MIWLLYLASMVYCIIKLQQRYEKTSLGGGIGVSPGLDVLMVVALAPILTIVDVSLTWIRLYKESHRETMDFGKTLLTEEDKESIY